MLEYMAFDFKKYGIICSVHSLNELIEQLTKSKFTGYKNIIVEIAEGALNSVQFLHSKGVAHRDLKPGNILLSNERKDPEMKVKLCDFGESWEILCWRLITKRHTQPAQRKVCQRPLLNTVYASRLRLRKPDAFQRAKISRQLS